MAGANTAAAADGTAQYYNPAILAFQYGSVEDPAEELSMRSTTLYHLNRTEFDFFMEFIRHSSRRQHAR